MCYARRTGVLVRVEPKAELGPCHCLIHLGRLCGSSASGRFVGRSSHLRIFFRYRFPSENRFSLRNSLGTSTRCRH
jgi:hypothetical protein